MSEKRRQNRTRRSPNRPGAGAGDRHRRHYHRLLPEDSANSRPTNDPQAPDSAVSPMAAEDEGDSTFGNILRFTQIGAFFILVLWLIFSGEYVWTLGEISMPTWEVSVGAILPLASFMYFRRSVTDTGHMIFETDLLVISGCYLLWGLLGALLGGAWGMWFAVAFSIAVGIGLLSMRRGSAR